MKQKVVIGIVAVVLIVAVAGYLFYDTLDVVQPKYNKKHDLINAYGDPYIKAQSFKPDQELVRAIALYIRWEGTETTPLSIRAYFVSSAQWSSWDEVPIDGEGEYIKKTFFAVMRKNTDMMIPIAIDEPVIIGQTYYIILKPIATATPCPWTKVYVLGSDYSSGGDAYPDGSIQTSVLDANLIYRPFVGPVVPEDMFFMVFTDTTQGPPTASFTWSPSSPSIGQEITFDASSSQNGAWYYWDFNNDGTTDTTTSGTTAKWSYLEEGTHTVELTVKNNIGEETSVTRQVTVGSGGGGTTTITIYTINELGAALNDVQIDMTGPVTKSGLTSSGKIQFTECPVGSYTYDASKANYNPSSGGFDISASNNEVTISLHPSGTAPPDVSILFTVKVKGVPYGGAIVSINDVEKITTSSGIAPFTVLEVPRGQTYSYNIEADGYTSSGGDVVVPSTGVYSKTIELTSSGGGDSDVLMEYLYLIIGIVVLAVSLIAGVLIPSMVGKIVTIVVGIAIFVIMLLLQFVLVV